MKILAVIEIDEDHKMRDINDLFDRLIGYECELKPIPKKYSQDHLSSFGGDYYTGYNHCLEDILGEEE